MRLRPLAPRLTIYLRAHNLSRRFAKQKRLLEQNPFHPSLNTELLEPRHLRIWSFRITRNYRAIFIYPGNGTVEIIDINDHYR